MTGPLKYEKLSDPVRREIDLALAVGRERLLDAHVEHALELVDRAGAVVAPPRALGIYLRLHSIMEPEAQILSHRVLVELGQRADEERERAEARLDQDRGSAGAAWDASQSVLHRLRKRLRGRVNQEFRRWVELHTGRTQVALLDIHVGNALRFVEILKPEDSYNAVVELYVMLCGIPNPWADMVYLFTLHRLSAPGSGPSDDGVPDSGEPPATEQRALRVIESTG